MDLYGRRSGFTYLVLRFFLCMNTGVNLYVRKYEFFALVAMVVGGGGQGVEGGQGVVPVTASVALRTLCDPRLLVPGAFGWMVYVPM